MLENPFPGMNPYMENPLLWGGIHSLIINYINAELNQVLPLGYATRIEERVYVQNLPRLRKNYVGDAAVVRTRQRPLPERGSSGGDGKHVATALLERANAPSDRPAFDIPLTLEWSAITVRETFLEVRSRSKAHELIAVIEVLSPANKQAGKGREEFLAKQSDLVRGGVHYLEIDLLREGRYTLAPDENLLREQVDTFDYFVSLHRADWAMKFDCWPILLPNRLPCVRFPLADDEEAVPLDLQAVVNRVYSEGGVWRSTDYAEEPVPPLSAKDAEWADALLREQSLR